MTACTLSLEQEHPPHLAALGEDLGALFCALDQRLAATRQTWELFTALYASGPERVDLLHDTARMFFSIAQQALWNEVRLGIAHLLAPERSSREPMLSVQHLPALLDAPGLRRDAEAKIAALEASARCAFAGRSRWSAHRGLGGTFERTPEPLDPATRADVEACLDGLADLLNAVQRRYTGRETRYRHGAGEGGAQALLCCLRDGLRREQDRQRAYRARDYASPLLTEPLGDV